MFLLLTNPIALHVGLMVGAFFLGWWAKKTYGDSKTAEAATLTELNKVAEEAKAAAKKEGL